MNDIIKRENALVEKISALAEDIDAIQQPRSDFALEHFAVGQHDTPGRQRMQAILELQIKMFNIRRAQLEEKKLMIQIEQQKEIVSKQEGEVKISFEARLAAVEIEKLETDLAEMNLARLGAIREAQCLLGILEKLPKYTYKQLQEEEALYWKARLSRQALTDLKAMGTVGAGNLEAIAQSLRVVGSKEISTLPDVEYASLIKLGN